MLNQRASFRIGSRLVLASAALFLIAILQSGCNPDSIASNGDNGTDNRPLGYTNVDRTQTKLPDLAIGTFNIQMFGKTKMSKPGVVKVLVDIAQRFDILAIQELRDKDQNVIPQFLELINAGGLRYAAAVGPRQGYVVKGRQTKYFEQTVFLYDTEKVEMIGNGYAARDQSGIMHRPPFVGHFRSTLAPIEEAFTFVLMNVHIDPDDVHVEFEALQNIIGGIYNNHPTEDDFILLGDLNDEPHRYQPYRWMSDQTTVIPSEVKTNTAQSKAYDNIIFDSLRTAEFQQRAGVLDLMSEYQLTLAEAQLVSDHMPVWAFFSAFEATQSPQEITQGNQSVIR